MVLKVLVADKDELQRKGIAIPGVKTMSAPIKGEGLPPGFIDPRCVGYDGNTYDLEAIIEQASDNLDYVASSTGRIKLPNNMLLTSMMIVADPFQHDVTTATIVAVQDAVDRLISGLSVTGSGSFFQLSNTLSYMKAISALNKHVYGGAIPHGDLGLTVGADWQSVQAWVINFGLDDHDMFDIRAGIPAEDETNLFLNATFGADDVIAVAAANGTIDVATDVYVILFGVVGTSKAYRARMPKPDFVHQHISSVATDSAMSLQGGRFLKRSTILNLGVAASNNEPRNDSNITDFTIEFTKPKRSQLINQMRWNLVKSMSQLRGRGFGVDRAGTAAINTEGLDGVAVIDWQAITKNPYGLDLTNFETGDVKYLFNMGTTTGSIHAYHEYYNLPDPSVAAGWPAFRPQ